MPGHHDDTAPLFRHAQKLPHRMSSKRRITRKKNPLPAHLTEGADFATCPDCSTNDAISFGRGTSRGKPNQDEANPSISFARIPLQKSARRLTKGVRAGCETCGGTGRMPVRLEHGRKLFVPRRRGTF